MAENKVKTVTKIASFLDCEKSFQNIETILNDLMGRINSKAESDIKEEEGETGDTKITQNADKSFSLEVRTQEGWKKGTVKGMPVRYGEKPKDETSILKKSIDEIEATDTSTGTEDAKKTIFDEKADKFVLARPDYDSGWHTWVNDDRDGSDNTPLTIAHGLGVLPSMIVSYYAPDQSPGSITWFTPFSGHRGASYANGAGCYVDNTNIYMWAGEGTTLVGIPWPITHCGRAVFYNGSVRTLLWK